MPKVIAVREEAGNAARGFRCVWVWDRTCSSQELSAWIQVNIYQNPVETPFDREDPTLDPEAGACLTCPRRTGFNTQQLSRTCKRISVDYVGSGQLAGVFCWGRRRRAPRVRRSCRPAYFPCISTRRFMCWSSSLFTRCVGIGVPRLHRMLMPCRNLGNKRELLFLSESDRNYTESISIWLLRAWTSPNRAYDGGYFADGEPFLPIGKIVCDG